MARTTYIGATKNRISQTVPGTASSGQSALDCIAVWCRLGLALPALLLRVLTVPGAGSATGFELRPDRVPGGVGGDRQLEQGLPGLERRLLHGGRHQVGRHVLLGDHLV